MSKTMLTALLALTLAAGCTPLSEGQVMVRGAGPDDLLKLRDGPGLEHDVIMGLPDGTRLIRRECSPAAGRVWCKVSLPGSSRVTGYVSAEYLAVI